MKKELLTIKRKYEKDNPLGRKESVGHIPFDAILYYYYDVYEESVDYTIVLVGCLKEITISKDEYDKVVDYFGGNNDD